MEVRKGFTFDDGKIYPDGLHLIDVTVSIYNTGFYILVRLNSESVVLREINQTTRNTPERVNDYLLHLCQKYNLNPNQITWKPMMKVIQDKKGFFKTKI